MEREIVVERGRYVPVGERDVEIVERKGLGHPDTLIDGIVEEISRELSKSYLASFGRILHHNVDKGQICGGATNVDFGGGVFTKPIYILLSGRATDKARGIAIPIHHIARKAAHDYLHKTVPELDCLRDTEIDSRISPGSADLVNLFLRSTKMPRANDTSFGTGFAPLSELESLVLATEKLLNSKDYKRFHPAVGSDIKVMGLREKNKIRLTVSCAFISKYIRSISQYMKCKNRVTRDIEAHARKLSDCDIEVHLNAADEPKRKSVYLTLTGTSAEMGDDGSVGRGNRVNGLITPFRSMTLEAAAGKNPVSHVGKLYSVLATETASAVASAHPEITDVTITLLSQIGSPINKPRIASISIISEGERKKEEATARRELSYALENISDLSEKIVLGKVPLF